MPTGPDRKREGGEAGRGRARSGLEDTHLARDGARQECRAGAAAFMVFRETQIFYVTPVAFIGSH